MKHIIIIGAGASGLTAAYFAAKNQAKVTVLEHTSKAGKKILVTGNGKCNLTNMVQTLEDYRGKKPEFGYELLKYFSVEDTISYMEELGIATKEKRGYVYPRSETAVTVQQKLLQKCLALGVTIVYDTKVDEIKKEKGKFLVTTNQGSYEGDACILATGSQAAPKTGSDGSGYTLAKALGLKIIKPLPALVQLCAEDKICKEASGVRCEVMADLYIQGEHRISNQGELQITDYGLSGIIVMQISRYAVEAMDRRKQVQISLDFFPEMTESGLAKKLYRYLEQAKEETVLEVLEGFLNYKLAFGLLSQMGIGRKKKARELDESWAGDMAHFMKNYMVELTGYKGFEQAQVCQGGVDTSQIQQDTMEVKEIPGLYVVGELLDVDGNCGGYNLQFAWGSGAVAGKNASMQN